MALLLLESFDNLASIGDAFTIASTPDVSNTVPRTGANACYCYGTAERFAFLTAANQTTGVLGFGLRIAYNASYDLTAPTGTSTALVNFNLSGATQVSVSLTSDGRFFVHRAGTVVGLSTGRGIKFDTWHYVEIKFKIADSVSSGEFVVYLDGEIVLNLGSGDTKAQTGTGIDTVSIGGANNSQGTYYDDLYFKDDTTVLGPIKVETVYPDGAGTTSDFTGSDGNSTDNHLLVDEATQDGDTSYVESSTAGHIDLYTLAALAGSPTTIHGVQVCNIAKKTDAGAKTARAVIRVGSTNYESANITPLEAYSSLKAMWATDPSTAAAWANAAAVNGIEAGVKVQA